MTKINMINKNGLLLFLNIFMCPYLIQAQSATLVNAKKKFDEGKYDESKCLFNNIGKNSIEYSDAKYYLGRICFHNKKYVEAIELLDEAIAINNKRAEYYFWLGNAYGEKAAQSNVFQQPFIAKHVVENWEIAANLDFSYQDVRWGLLNFYSQAPSFMGGGMDKAYKVADELNKLNYPDGFEAKGIVYERDNKKDLAEGSFKEAIKISPKELKYYYALAYFYDRQKRYDRSEELFEQIIAINPDEANANFELGRLCSTNNKKFVQGLQFLNHFIQITNPNNKIDLCKANYYLGNIYNSKGDKINAKNYYNKALSLDATFIDAQKALKKL